MIENEYLDIVHEFVEFLVDVLNGEEIQFQYNEGGDIDRTIHDALLRYAWPARRLQIQMPDHHDRIIIPGNANFDQNTLILEQLQGGLREAFHNHDNERLSGWARAVLQWGAVYRYGRGEQGGNRGWLEENGAGLHNHLVWVCDGIGADNDDWVNQIVGLRSNAGFTKIYSLLCDNFVIYDSRVAAGLAWLVQWHYRRNVPELLRFRLPPQNGRHMRNPDNEIFGGTGANSHTHMLWNIRVNWILSAAVLQAHEQFGLRELEAALFVLGYDLGFANNQPVA